MRNLLYFILFLLAAQVSGQESSLFNQATQQYAAQNYQAAIKSYKAILTSGKESTEVYFNLANAYYKTDAVAPSIYYYNKALQLSPGDEAVQTNLMFAKKRIVDVIEETPKTGFSEFVENLISTFNYDTWAVLAIVFVFSFAGFGLWYYFTRKSGQKRTFFVLSTLTLLCTVLCVVFAYQQFDVQKSKDYAIVFADQVGIHTEPNHNSTQAFLLHEGTKVKVLEQFNGYAKIKLADGSKGWLETGAIKEL